MKKFQRKIENFKCGHCGFEVTGNGYTNHCPKCLWSKHVDVNPGDRMELCQGLMKPIGIAQDHGEYVIIHKCEKCKAIRRVKTDPTDDYQEILKLAST